MTSMTNDENLLASKAETYTICSGGDCDKADNCLRHMLADHVPPTRVLITSVNPDHVRLERDGCRYYRSTELVETHRGLKRFYDDIPELVARDIRHELVSHYGNSNYYRYRGGELPITLDVKAHIEAVCRKHGWTGELSFDSSGYEYQW